MQVFNIRILHSSLIYTSYTYLHPLRIHAPLQFLMITQLNTENITDNSASLNGIMIPFPAMFQTFTHPFFSVMDIHSTELQPDFLARYSFHTTGISALIRFLIRSCFTLSKTPLFFRSWPNTLARDKTPANLPAIFPATP